MVLRHIKYLLQSLTLEVLLSDTTRAPVLHEGLLVYLTPVYSKGETHFRETRIDRVRSLNQLIGSQIVFLVMVQYIYHAEIVIQWVVFHT